MAELENPRALITGMAKRNASVPELQFIRDDEDGVVLEELKGGYANYTYKVMSKDKSKSVIIKHGLDHFKVFNKQKAPLRRRRVEYEMMKRMDALKPGSAPKPFCLDMEDNIIVMEDLSHMMMLRHVTEAGQIDEDAMRLTAQLLASLHWSTQEKNVTEDEWKELKDMFGLSPLVSGVRDFTLVEMVDPNAQSIEYPDEMKEIFMEVVSDTALRAKINELRKLCDTERCLIHSDNHHGSIFLGQGRAVFFDFEVSSLSVPEFNIGFFLTWFICVLHMLPDSAEKEEIRKRFRRAITIFFDTYIKDMPDMKDEAYRRRFISNTTAYLAATAYRTIACPGIGQYFPGSSAARASVMRLTVAGLRAADSVTTVDGLLDLFFPEPRDK